MKRGIFVLKKVRKDLIALGAAIVLLAGLLVAIGINSGEAKLNFVALEEAKIPQAIVTDVIPEYRELERALACKVDDKIYVIVTRGEKPTTGFEVAIDRMSLKQEDEKSKLIVYAKFADPAKGASNAQVLSYPYAVAEVEIRGLPDMIELQVQYL